MNNYIQEAITEAITGYQNGEGGPFGALIIKDDNIIARGHNTVLKENDPTCHAEINAIKKACKYLNNHSLKGCILITTSEPCPLCFAALKWAGIKDVIACADKFVAADFGFNDVNFEDKNLVKITFCEDNVKNNIITMFNEWKNTHGIIY